MRGHSSDSANAGRVARLLAGGALDAALRDAHQYTAALLAAIGRSRSTLAHGWTVPRLPTINPPLWEYGHLAWFAEWWTLRDAAPAGNRDDGAWVARRPSSLRDADRWFDSARVAHDTRWTLDLPAAADIAAYVGTVGEEVARRLAQHDGGGDDAALYPYRLALFHEDMHGEALTCLCQALDYPAPDVVDASPTTVAHDAGSVAVAATRFVRGLADDAGFVFDNERRAMPVDLALFSIDRDCVTNEAFRAFVDAGGYRDARWWPGEAGRWRATHAVDHPLRWRRGHPNAGPHDGPDDDPRAEWRLRWFGAWLPLPLDAPVCHVNAFEAEAYCRWAGRRLPREAEWECAAVAASDADAVTPQAAPANSADDAPFRWGRAVWEWTADAFEPYPGFTPDRYREYSAPWFGSHRAVRGASFATRARMRHPRYRNFYTPDRNDLFVGFRTCAP